MTIHTAWDDTDHTVIRLEFFGDWTWKELERAIAKVMVMRTEVEHNINVIGDLRFAGRVPPSFLTQARRFIEKQPDGINLTVLVGLNDVMQIFWKIVLRTYGQIVSDNRLTTTSTIEEAYEFFAAQAGDERRSA